MNILHTYQRVVHYFHSNPSNTVRQAAEALEVSKSAVHRHQQAIKQRNLYPESRFWDSEEGQNWLCRLIVAVLFSFVVQRGIGVETITSFLQLLRLDTHLGVSPSALRSIVERIENKIEDYTQHRKAEIQQSTTLQDVTIGVDETFFEQMILVAMDLRSGFIFSEDFVQNRDYGTGANLTLSHEQTWKIRIRQVISDRSPTLIKLAEKGWKCLHLPDLFHATYEIVKALGLGLSRTYEQATKEVQLAQA